jgi:hypothetical protein
MPDENGTVKSSLNDGTELTATSGITIHLTIAIVAALLLAAICTEQLAVCLRMHHFGPDTPWGEVLSGGWVTGTFLASFLVFLFMLVLKYATLQEARQKISKCLSGLAGMLQHLSDWHFWLAVSSGILVLVVTVSFWRNEPWWKTIGSAARKATHEFQIHLGIAAYLLVACLALVLAYLAVQSILLMLKRSGATALEVYHEWFASMLVAFGFTLLFAFWNYLVLRNALGAGGEPLKHLVRGHLKDLVVLLVVAGVFVSGLFRWADMIAGHPQKVTILVWILGLSVFIAAGLLILDFQYAAAIESKRVADIPDTQRELLVFHTHFRAWLYLALMVVVFFHTIFRAVSGGQQSVGL